MMKEPVAMHFSPVTVMTALAMATFDPARSVVAVAVASALINSNDFYHFHVYALEEIW